MTLKLFSLLLPLALLLLSQTTQGLECEYSDECAVQNEEQYCCCKSTASWAEPKCKKPNECRNENNEACAYRPCTLDKQCSAKGSCCCFNSGGQKDGKCRNDCGSTGGTCSHICNYKNDCSEGQCCCKAQNLVDLSGICLAKTDPLYGEGCQCF